MFGWEDFYAAALIMVVLCCCRRYLDSSSDGSHGRPWILGLALGLLGLLLPTAGVVFIGWLVWMVWSARLTLLGKSTLVVVLLPALVVGPWLIRNYSVFHRIILVRDNLGLELAISNNNCAKFGIAQNLASGCFGKVHPNANANEARKVLAYGEPKYNDLRLEQAGNGLGITPAHF
jgi:4-amino-4-deoxy-L-arabinose transferase-like glycosyltransferase